VGKARAIKRSSYVDYATKDQTHNWQSQIQQQFSHKVEKRRDFKHSCSKDASGFKAGQEVLTDFNLRDMLNSAK
jgi:hypothetical protein